MKLNHTANPEMKNNLSNRIVLAALITALGVFQTSCTTSTSEAWSRIQNEGLIPYMVDGQSKALPTEAVPSTRKEMAIATTEITSVSQEIPIFGAGLITAQPVENKPGFVYSPHTETLLMVDVTDYKPGTHVRCPYTKKSFVVPGKLESASPVRPQAERMIATTPVRRSPMPAPSAPKRMEVKTETAPSEIVIVKPKIEEFEKMAVVDELPIDAPITSDFPKNQKPPTSELLALPQKEAVPSPVGKRVPGKPSYVFSPFASSNQVVDVEGHAPGTNVKCPYTGKVFTVPAEAAAE